MDFKSFLWDKKIYIISGITSSVFLYILFSSVFRESSMALLASVTVLIFEIIPLLGDYFKRKGLYEDLNETSGKYGYSFLRNYTSIPSFTEGRETVKHLRGAVAEYEKLLKEVREEKDAYRDFLSMWVHEVKTPLSSAAMTIYSMEEFPGLKSIEEDLKRIEEETEKVLYFSKKDDTEKDYRITEISLKDIVQSSLKNNSKSLIKSGFKVNLKNLDNIVYTDIRWMTFIIGQLISNAVKYRGENPEISFSSFTRGNSVILLISDNGTGISKEDEERIFDRGFTGKNSSMVKSTGYGLYIVKTLLMKLGLSIEFSMSETTDFYIIFPVSSHNRKALGR